MTIFGASSNRDYSDANNGCFAGPIYWSRFSSSGICVGLCTTNKDGETLNGG